MKSGEVNKAVAYYERALAADPRDVRTHLSLAAALIGRGDDSAACSHLAVYVRAYPEQLPMRVHYAELLYRLHRPESAKVEFQRIIADAQDDVMPAEEEMLQCHTRLMEIAEAEGDDYGEHLHRGIGVYYLARKREALADAECKLSTESLLCQAAGELALARLERPEEARAYWYLYEVWKKLGQHRPALKNLRLAEERAAFSALTAGERRGLYLAGVELATKTELRR